MTAWKPTHQVREVGAETWTDVRADGIEPQTYRTRRGRTIYAGIWFQNKEVRRHPDTLVLPTEPGDYAQVFPGGFNHVYTRGIDRWWDGSVILTDAEMQARVDKMGGLHPMRLVDA